MDANLGFHARLVLESGSPDAGKPVAKAAGTDVSSGDRIRLKASNGNYLMARDSDVLSIKNWRGFLQSFVIETSAGGPVHSGDTIYLRTMHGTRLSAGKPLVKANWDHRGAWQAFVIENSARDGEIHIGDLVTLRTYNGRYLSRGRWNYIRTDGQTQGLEEQFTLESASGVSLLQS